MLDCVNILQIRARLLEPILVAAVLSVTALLWSYQVAEPVLLHLYYVPVVLTGFYLGQYRARLMALLCVLTATVIFWPHIRAGAEPIELTMLLAFGLWGTMLYIIGVMVGTLSDRWRASLDSLTASHKRDVLTDPLTGIANRRAFEFELTRRIAAWNRNQTPVALAMIDIDFFKKFNDRYGHQAGDVVLREVAQTLQDTVRQTDLVARYGGEEFAVLLTCNKPGDAEEIAEEIRSLVEQIRLPFAGLKLRVTVSVGIAHIRAGEDAIALVQRADAALYSSKEVGRNCSHLHDGVSCRPFGNGITTTLVLCSLEEDDADQILDRHTDETTGLPTQKVFLDEFRRRVSERDRYGTRLSVAIIEFAEQHADDELHARKNLLVTTAKLASTVLRDTEMIARFDNNSLAALFPSTALDQLVYPLERLGHGAATYVDPKYAKLDYAVSIGAVEVMLGEHPGSALQRLDGTLQKAKADGGGRICIHDGQSTLTLLETKAPSAASGQTAEPAKE